MILKRTAKGQTVFAQLLYAPQLAAQSAHAAPTQSRYTCDGAMKWYLFAGAGYAKECPRLPADKERPQVPAAGVTFVPF